MEEAFAVAGGLTPEGTNRACCGSSATSAMSSPPRHGMRESRHPIARERRGASPSTLSSEEEELVGVKAGLARLAGPSREARRDCRRTGGPRWRGVRRPRRHSSTGRRAPAATSCRASPFSQCCRRWAKPRPCGLPDERPSSSQSPRRTVSYSPRSGFAGAAVNRRRRAAPPPVARGPAPPARPRPGNTTMKAKPGRWVSIISGRAAANSSRVTISAPSKARPPPARRSAPSRARARPRPLRQRPP